MQRLARLAHALLASAQRAEILGRLGHRFAVEAKHDATGRRTADRHVKEDLVGHLRALGIGRLRIVRESEEGGEGRCRIVSAHNGRIQKSRQWSMRNHIRHCYVLCKHTVSDAKATKRKSDSAIAHTTFLAMDTIGCCFFWFAREIGAESDELAPRRRGVLAIDEAED